MPCRSIFLYIHVRPSLPTTSVTRLGNFLKPLATINFWKGVKIYHFHSEIILGNS